MTTIETITNEQIESLAYEAGQHGDLEQVELCREALQGDDDARHMCLVAIRNAEAQAHREYYGQGR